MTEEQREELQRLANTLIAQATEFYSMWGKPMKYRLTLPPYNRRLSKYGLTVGDLVNYIENSPELKIKSSPATQARHIFPAHVSDDEIVEKLLIYDQEAEEIRQMKVAKRKAERNRHE